MEIEFGYWPKVRKLDFSIGAITPLDGLKELIDSIEKTTYHKNGLMHPPIHETHESEDDRNYAIVPHSQRGAEIYHWYPTHNLTLKNNDAFKMNDFGNNPSFYLLQTLGFIEGVRCTPSEWWFFGKLPLKNTSNAHFSNLETAINIAIETWLKLEVPKRKTLTNILHFYNSIVGFKWFWERFSHEYSVFDACWRYCFPNNQIGTTKVNGHSKRISSLLTEFGIKFDAEHISNIVAARNNLIHELSWSGETFLTEGNSHQLRYTYDLRRMNHRIIGQLLGMKGQYFQSAFTSIGVFGVSKSDMNPTTCA